jgi:tRNA(adenine34) deaminase
MGMKDSTWMAKAYALALKSEQLGEVPVGAVLVDKDQRLIGQGWNQVIHQQDPTAHAEIIAIREAAKSLSQYRLEGCTLFVTLEPCIMCAGALVQARIQRLVFATRDFKAGAAGSVCNLLKGAPFNHAIKIDEGPMQGPCSALLIDFFAKKRFLQTFI